MDIRLDAARGWLDALHIDPFHLDSRGQNGRLHVMEQLDAYAELIRFDPTVRDRVGRIAAITADREWVPSDDRLKGALVPWLRSTMLLDRMGASVDPAVLWDQKNRIEAHLEGRTSAVRGEVARVFRWFGVPETAPLDVPGETGLLGRRPDVASLKIAEAYDLVHEVLRRFDRGNRWWATVPDRGWTVASLRALIDRYQAKGNADFVASALHALACFEPGDTAWIESRQNPDGSWGDRAKALERFGDLADPALLLHTTGAAVAAIAARERPFRDRDTFPAEARAALDRARRWLGTFTVDPIALDGRGIPGKKILVEQLDAIRILHRAAPEAEKPALREHFGQVAAITRERRYHDMLEVDARRFRSVSTSYLRAAWLVDQMGFDTTLYRDQIRLVKGRLDRHMPERGVHQLLVFRHYYRHFGLPEPFPFDQQPFGLLARRPDPATLSPDDVYGVTHEIMVPYMWGDYQPERPFDAEILDWLRPALVTLARTWMAKVNADLAGELIFCFRLLGWTDEPTYQDGLRWLIRRQNADGSWGRWERVREKFGEDAIWRVILHTTGVCVEALAGAGP